MRLTTRDPKAQMYDVYLDGKLLNNCMVADEEGGTVIVVTDRNTPKAQQHLLEGVVELRRRDR